MPMSWGRKKLAACIEQKEVQGCRTGMNKGVGYQCEFEAGLELNIVGTCRPWLGVPFSV